MRCSPLLSSIIGAAALASLGLALAACSTSTDAPLPPARLGGSHADRAGYQDGPQRYGHGAQAGTAGELKEAIGDIVYFASDSADLTPDGQTTLAAQARWLRRYADRMVTIEGHADERGTREYNIALGERRAFVVRQFLTSQGVEAGRIRTTSYGKERPVATCDDISCWSRNRRVQTVLNGTMVSRR